MTTIQPTSTLPRIIAILGVDDHGPCDPEPTASCPHCGADGRYIYKFLCEDGSTRGAMRGCLQLFPQHNLSRVVAQVMKKKLDYLKKGWRLASWDVAILKATDDLRAGTIDAAMWERQVKSALFQRKSYVNNRYRR